MERYLNAPWLFNNFKSSGYYVPQTIVDEIKALNINGLRFMGGTLGNYYDSLKPGYGYEQTQATENYLSRLSYLLSQLPNTKVSFVVNVYQALMGGDVNYWIDNMLNVLTKIPQIAYCEIGNEINISGEYMGVGDKPRLFQSTTKFNAIVAGKANNYLQIADKFVDAIRAHNPDIKIGLPMGNYEKVNARNKEWNRVLRTYTKHDLEIFHIYLKTKTFMDTKSEINRSIGGAKKPVIITEWSWEHGNSDTNVKNTSDIGQSYYKNFFVDFPQACQQLNVQMICRHQLAGDNVYSIIKI
jgi:hypothetical protein